MHALIRSLVVLLASIFFVGCASIDKTMESWVGSHQSDLIASWGPPQQVMSDGQGGSILIYSNTRSYTAPGQATTTVTGSANTYGNTTYGSATGYTTYTPPKTTSYDATRTFWVDSSGYIYRWAWRGL